MSFKNPFTKWLMPEGSTDQEVTNNSILNELIACFDDSCYKQSVGKSLLFNMHFLVLLHPDTYETRMQSLAPIVNEAVKEFYLRIAQRKMKYAEIVPVSSVWHFKFGPASVFNNETIREKDIKVIGVLTGLKHNAARDNSVPATTTKVTMRVKATNAYDKMDINPQIFKHINFLDSGTFEIKFSHDLSLSATPVQQQNFNDNGIATIEYYVGNTGLAGKYVMQDKEIVIARKEATNAAYSNYLLIESAGVSNPHARIKYNEAERKFQIASFSSNETRVNEILINKSELDNPRWNDLPDHSQLLLNTMITLQFKKNQIA
ncbi:MAG: hypothetical protein JWM28_4526 [Chitinophagaceae bacterium]|nr:hypothetical protein [Chitinophagaceae bacterium]